PDMLMDPTWSASGRGSADPLPAANCTRKCAPGATSPSSAMFPPDPPPDDLYSSRRPASGMLSLVGLNSSTKSFDSEAPLLPPPPYTSLMTRPDPSGAATAVVGAAARPATSIPAAAIVAAARRLGWWGIT